MVAAPRDGPLPARESRRSPRKRYPVIQAVAPYSDHRAPTKAMLSRVRCHDISQGGISFLWPEAPQATYFLVGLRSTADCIWLKARVVRSRPISGLDGEFLVCCRFEQRVEHLD